MLTASLGTTLSERTTQTITGCYYSIKIQIRPLQRCPPGMPLVLRSRLRRHMIASAISEPSSEIVTTFIPTMPSLFLEL